MSATSSPNKDAVLAYLRAREMADLDLLANAVSDDFHHIMNGRDQDRADLFAEVAGAPFTGTFQVDALVEEDDMVACRYRFEGTHTGPLPIGRGRVIEARGAPVSYTGMFIAVIRDGRLASGWGEYDSASILRQTARQ
jgi:predicted ester cyclase